MVMWDWKKSNLETWNPNWHLIWAHRTMAHRNINVHRNSAIQLGHSCALVLRPPSSVPEFDSSVDLSACQSSLAFCSAYRSTMGSDGGRHWPILQGFFVHDFLESSTKQRILDLGSSVAEWDVQLECDLCVPNRSPVNTLCIKADLKPVSTHKLQGL